MYRRSWNYPAHLQTAQDSIAGFGARKTLIFLDACVAVENPPTALFSRTQLQRQSALVQRGWITVVHFPVLGAFPGSARFSMAGARPSAREFESASSKA